MHKVAVKILISQKTQRKDMGGNFVRHKEFHYECEIVQGFKVGVEIFFFYISSLVQQRLWDRNERNATSIGPIVVLNRDTNTTILVDADSFIVGDERPSKLKSIFRLAPPR